jgi:hypothetical protein
MSTHHWRLSPALNHHFTFEHLLFLQAPSTELVLLENQIAGPLCSWTLHSRYSRFWTAVGRGESKGLGDLTEDKTEIGPVTSSWSSDSESVPFGSAGDGTQCLMHSRQYSTSVTPQTSGDPGDLSARDTALVNGSHLHLLGVVCGSGWTMEVYHFSLWCDLDCDFPIATTSFLLWIPQDWPIIGVEYTLITKDVTLRTIWCGPYFKCFCLNSLYRWRLRRADNLLMITEPAFPAGPTQLLLPLPSPPWFPLTAGLTVSWILATPSFS